MFRSVRAKLGVIFLGFLLLVAGSVAATLVGLQAQRADALVINLAGRQRMLSQMIAKATLGVARDPAAGHQKELFQAVTLFDQTLQALAAGGSAYYDESTVTLPAAKGDVLRDQLEVVAVAWEHLKKGAEFVGSADPSAPAFGGAVDGVTSWASVVLQETDKAVQLFEQAAQQKLAHIRTIQTLFFVSAIGLLIGGFLVTQRSIVEPLYALQQSASGIAGGDLQTPIQTPTSASGEVGALVGSLEQMRRELATSRQKLEVWAAELDGRVRERTQQLTALFDLSIEISAEPEIGQVLESVVQKTRELAGGEVAVLCLLDAPEEILRVAAVSGPRDALSARREIRIGDLAPGDKPCGAEGAAIHEGADCALLRPGFRHSHLGVPVKIGDRILGMLCVGHREESHFQEEQTQMLTLLAQAGAVALENARWHERAGREAVLAERERLLGEIHDGLAQTLSYLDLRLGLIQSLVKDKDLAEVPEHLTLTRRTVEQAGQEVRRLLAGLESEGPSSQALEDLLRQEATHWAADKSMDIEFRSDIQQSIQERRAISEQVVRIVHEALTNARKHAPESRAILSLSEQDGEILVSVRDEGAGFRVDGPLPEGHHFGLKVMRARAERIGALLSIESAPGQGTAVILRWPRPGNGGQPA